MKSIIVSYTLEKAKSHQKPRRLANFFPFFFEEAKPLFYHFDEDFKRRLDNKVQQEDEEIDLWYFLAKPLAHPQDRRRDETQEQQENVLAPVHDREFADDVPHPHAEEANNRQEEQEDDNREPVELQDV